MPAEQAIDYYEVLQISPNADPETVHRVYRLLGQRCHPDNAETGNADEFRRLSEAYHVISDPEQRARYDVLYAQRRQDRWRIVAAGQGDNDYEAEQRVRLTVLEVLYTQRRLEPGSTGLSPLDLELMIGQPREHLEFTIWYLTQKKFITRSDSSMLVITVDGVEHLEANSHVRAPRRLRAASA